MTRLNRHGPLCVLVLLALVAVPRAARADCTSPAAVESTTIYDSTAHALKICDGTSWLSVTGGASSGTAGYIQFSNGTGGFSSDSTAGGQLFWDSPNHRLGIGTTSPDAMLTVNAGGQNVMTLYADEDNWRGIWLENDSAGTAAYAAFAAASDTGTVETGIGSSATGDIYQNRAYVAGVNGADGLNWVTTKASGDLRVYTGGDLAANERMRITSAGNVGIGTTTPAAALDVNGGIKVGNNAGGCSSTNSGEIRYASGSSPPYNYCNGSAWVPFESSGWVAPYTKFPAAQVFLGIYHTCALKSTGALWCWGYNNYGELGDGTTTIRRAPTQASAAFAGPWSSISVSVYNTCGIKSADGSGWCWGYNGYGQIGDGTTTTRSSAPVQISGTWTQLATGGTTSSTPTANAGYYTCGVKSDNTGWCWGGNGSGNLGDGTTTQQNSPEQIAGSWRGIWPAPYGSYTCGIKTDDSLWCWGYGGYGQIGDGTTTDHATPVQISGSWKLVALAERTTCAIKTDDSLWCWGQNSYGQIGDGTTTARTSPVQIAGSWSKVTVSSGSSQISVWALKIDGSAWSWGYNGTGETKTSTASYYVTSPTAIASSSIVSGTQWTDFQANYSGVCGLRDDSTLYCWGQNNYYNRFGDPNVLTYFTPVGG
jgi:alpha-tubulin suppressor-like RCC1 family protein